MPLQGKSYNLINKTMRTISQVADDYARRVDEKYRGVIHPKTASLQGFLDGVAYTEEWILVEEELPEKAYDKDSDDWYWYLVKGNPAYSKKAVVYGVASYMQVAKDEWRFMGMRNDFYELTITHWRPINRK